MFNLTHALHRKSTHTWVALRRPAAISVQPAVPAPAKQRRDVIRWVLILALVVASPFLSWVLLIAVISIGISLPW
jgi:hypothetical protein